MLLPLDPVLTPALLQSARAIPTSPLELILKAEPVTQVVLALLAVLSLTSWTIMFSVWRQMANATKAAGKFSAEFEHTSRLEEGTALAKRVKANALSRILMRAMHFVSETRTVNEQARERERAAGTASGSTTLSGSQIETLHLVLDAEASAERDRLGRFIPWLATIASASPLIGLLGTVLGIINSFLGIARGGSGNISAVAPGVGEALTATAMALAVAIPATFGYNILANRLNRFDGAMESFGTTVIARLVREGHI